MVLKNTYLSPLRTILLLPKLKLENNLVPTVLKKIYYKRRHPLNKVVL